MKPLYYLVKDGMNWGLYSDNTLVMDDNKKHVAVFTDLAYAMAACACFVGIDHGVEAMMAPKSQEWKDTVKNFLVINI